MNTKNRGHVLQAFLIICVNVLLILLFCFLVSIYYYCYSPGVFWRLPFLTDVLITSMVFSPSDMLVVGSMGPLILIAFVTAFTLFAKIAREVRVDETVPPEFLEQLTFTVHNAMHRDAYQLVRSNHSMLAEVMLAGIERLRYGIDDARHVARKKIACFRSRIEHDLVYLEAFAILCPLLAFAGTVWIMIEVWLVLAIP